MSVTAADSVAEREGFEPPVPTRSTTDFESAAFDHSATSPGAAILTFAMQRKPRYRESLLADCFEAVHVRLQRGGYRDAAVGMLVIL
jgi:hypothetical protein